MLKKINNKNKLVIKLTVPEKFQCLNLTIILHENKILINKIKQAK